MNTTLEQSTLGQRKPYYTPEQIEEYLDNLNQFDPITAQTFAAWRTDGTESQCACCYHEAVMTFGDCLCA